MGSDYRKLQQKNLERIEKYVAKLNKLYSAATSRLVGLSTSVDFDRGAGEQFYFSNYPELEKEVNKIAAELATGMEQTILQGTSAEWAKGAEDTNGTVDYVLEKAGIKSTDSLTDEAIGKLFNNHDAALKAFQKRQIGGMNLSEKVWNLAEHQKIEVELARSIADGTSADELALSIQQYLKEPDKLFRRVRDEYDVLRLSKNAKAYQPGVGTYRSSYKNAMRLARTEINMAYRNAEIESYQDKDYVVGYEVHRSTHPYNCPVCEELKGKYPKAFDWSGWHPQCRCYITPILLTDEEIKARRDAIINGDDFDTTTSKNYINNVPDGFTKWVEANGDRISSAFEGNRLPYFLRDNPWAWADKYKSLAVKNGFVPLASGKPINTSLERKSFVLDGGGLTDEQYCRKFRSALYTVYGRIDGIGVQGAFGKPLKYMQQKEWALAAKAFKEETPTPYLRQLEMLNKIAEINKLYKKVSGLSIPSSWRNELTRCLSSINAAKKGWLFKEWHNVESAYNICKLSTLDEVIKCGYDKVSMKMPYNLLTTFKKCGAPISISNLKREFFDKFEKFVPLETRWNVIPWTRYKDYGVAWYYPKEYNNMAMVIIPIETNLGTLRRLRRASNSQRSTMVYHEFGHAFDIPDSLSSQKTFLDFFKKWYGINDEQFSNLKEKYFEIISSKIDENNCEDAKRFSDVIQALRKDADGSRICGGHDDGYYYSNYIRRLEIFAQGTAAKYVGNSVLKELCPQLYQDLISVMNKMFR